MNIKLEKSFRTQVFRRAAEGLGGRVVRDVLLGKPKVGHVDMALGVQQQVLRLHVPADKSLPSVSS
jgi:hypothetical protein